LIGKTKPTKYLPHSPQRSALYRIQNKKNLLYLEYM
jgi:hypothetical protein